MIHKKNYFWLYLLTTIVICCGIFFRLVNIDKKVYWHDEVHTSLRVSGYISSEVTAELFTGDIITANDLLQYQQISPDKTFNDALLAFAGHPEHPPLYYIWQRFWQGLWGSSIVTSRSLSALFSILILPVVYWLSKELFTSPQISLIIVSLVAISPLQILYAQEARQYSLWMLTTIVTSLFFLRGIKNNQLNNWYLYLISFIINIYTSLLSFLTIPIYSFYLIFSDFNTAKNRLRFIIFSAIGCLTFIPWLRIIIINYDLMQGSTNWLQEDKPLSDLANAWGINLSRLFADFSWAQYNIWSDVIVFASYVLVAWSVIYLLQKTPKNTWLFLILFTLLPFLILVLPDIFFDSFRSTVTRYLVAYYMGIYLIVGYCLATHIINNQQKTICTMTYILLIVIGMTSNLDIMNEVTWWNKALGNQINYITYLINPVEKPLIIMEERGISMGLITSLSHTLKPEINIQLVPKNIPLEAEDEYQHIFVVNPSPELITEVESTYQQKLTDGFENHRFNNPTLYSLQR